MPNKVKERLLSFGYELQVGDEAILTFCTEKAESVIKNDCNVREVPEGLMHIAVDMAVGEFLQTKKTFAPDDLQCLDLSSAVKQIQEGDTNITLGAAEGCQTDEQRLDAIINYLLSYGQAQFAVFRKIRW